MPGHYEFSKESRLCANVELTKNRAAMLSPKSKTISTPVMRNISVLFVLLLIAFFLRTPAAVADTVTLTSGTVTTEASLATINVTTGAFALHYSGETSGSPTSFSINSVTSGIGLSNLTYQSFASSFFRGSVGFNNSNVTGSLTAFGSMQDMFFNQNPLFTLNFNGSGFITITTLGEVTRTQFIVTSVPEPATMIQLFTGLLATGGLITRTRLKLLRK